MKIALLTTALFDRPSNGGERCTQRLIDALCSLGHEVHVAGRGEGQPAGVRSASSLGPREPPFNTLGRADQVGALLRAAWRGEASSLSRLGSTAQARQANRWLDEQGADRLLIDHLQAMVWLPDARPDLLLMHNHESVVYSGQLRDSRGPLRRAVLAREARLLRRYENAVLPRCRAIACLSETDRERLGAQLGDAADGLAIDVLPGHAAPSCLPALAAPGRRFGAIGTWTWAPNRHGLQWLLREVWPLLPTGSELLLAGSGLQGLQLPVGVRSLGRVAEPTQLYAEANIVLVPALHGSGVQEKAIEAIASGRCVIATAHALRGLGPGLPSHVHAALDAREFASLCVSAALPEPPCAHAETTRWASARHATYLDRLSRLLRLPAVRAAA